MNISDKSFKKIPSKRTNIHAFEYCHGAKVELLRLSQPHT